MKRALIAGLVLAALTGIACSGAGNSSSGSGTAIDGGTATTSTATAASTPTETAPAITTAPAGTALELTQSGGKASITVSEPKAGVKAKFGSPDNGQYVTIKVSMNVTSGTVKVASWNFVFVSPEGGEYDAELVSVIDPDLKSTDAVAGQKVTGTVSFDVPKGAEKGGKIAYKDILGSSHLAYWTI